ncbi:DEAD/DEAH box helicase family protein [Frankia sp. Cr2]|uniref:DEAD/DEAH box helicase family protein n=1 Tax=Frankia sp. Cr2 TaxID=3073932 RepID=UPI002AD2517D|nr:DEAD/DEAH box helicase family protein [Frankia sp. Cr2]
MDARIEELARRSANFGFLLPHEPLLVFYGAGAESYAHSDPNAALIKARQFGEVLAKALVNRAGLPTRGDKQVDRLAALGRAGVFDGRIRAAFDAVRTEGNRAVHGYYGEVRAAVRATRACFELGVWFHRLVTGDRKVIAFVPPPEPGRSQPGEARPASSAAEDAERAALRAELAEYRGRLAEAKLRLDGGGNNRLDAERRARREAEEALTRALADAESLRFAFAALPDQVGDEPQPAGRTGKRTGKKKVSAAERESFVAQAKSAAREPRTEIEVRAEVDRMLTQAGWSVQDLSSLNLIDPDGVALREGRTATGPADYLLFVNRRLVGVVEAKREGTVLTPVEGQSGRYASSLTDEQRGQAWRWPLPFRYETTAAETHFTNTLDPRGGRARSVFSFHRPTTLARWMRDADADPEHPTLRHRLAHLPPLAHGNLRPAQLDAVGGLERSLADDRPRALIQMATGAGKTYAAVTSSYRLLAHANARRILFLVDRNNLGRQAREEFATYVTAGDGRKFTELYNVEPLTAAGLLGSTHVVISTVQRLYAMLRGRPVPDPDVDDRAFDADTSEGTSGDGAGDSDDEPIDITYSADIPPETFDLIIVDECHRSIYGRWRAVLEYFDAYLVGLTATPVKQTFGFFHQNLVSEYTYPQAVADGVNVDFDVYRIRTELTRQGATIEAGITVPRRDRRTRQQRYEELEDDFSWTPEQLGRSVVSPNQIELVLRTFKDRLFTEIFPGRTHVPKTLIFAKDDNHAEDIVMKVREVFGQGNEFATKITYSVRDTDSLLKAFRNSAELRIVVTVDMIATGTDVRPLECLLFLRNPRSAVLFEQMKGRGSRTIDGDDFRAVTPDSSVKDRFVLVDAVGVLEGERLDAAPLAQHTDKQISLEKLLRRTGTLTIDADEVCTLASRLARLNQQITPDERAELEQLAGESLASVVSSLARCADADALDAARQAGPGAQRALVEDAVRPLAANPALRARLLEIRRAHDITYDEVNPDTLLEAAGVDRTELAQRTVASWRAYLREHQAEISAIQLGYERGTGQQPVYAALKELAGRIARPPHQWTPERLWDAYERLELAAAAPEVKYGALDLIGLIRFELGVDETPRPHRTMVHERFEGWIIRQRQASRREFTADERWWLERIRDIVVTSAAFAITDLDESPFTERGGTDGFLTVFGEDRALPLITDLTHGLTA